MRAMRSHARLALLFPFFALGLSAIACKGSSSSSNITADPAPSCSCSCPPAGAAAAALSLDLPKAASGSGETETLVVVTLDAHGAMTVNGAPAANDSDVEAAAKTAIVHSPSVHALIQADASVAHGKVIHVLDVLRRAGVSKISFAVAPP